MDANKPGGPMDGRAHAPGDPHAHEVRAEPAGVDSRIVVGFGVVLVILTIVAMALMAAIFRGLDRRAEKRDAASVAAAGLQRPEGGIPPPPRLLIYEPRHWKDFRDAETERLSTYGWMDRSTGAVHVPIERAMDLIAVRGVGPLPAAPVALPGQAATPVPQPTASPEKKK
jgi:hypothetical protein